METGLDIKKMKGGMTVDANNVEDKPSKKELKPSKSHRTTPLIEDFEQDIRELGYKIDAFRTERRKLVEMIRIENEGSQSDMTAAYDQDQTEEDISPPIERSSLEPLPNERTHQEGVYSLTGEVLEQAYKASLRREQSLIEDNRKLLHLLHQLGGEQPIMNWEPPERVDVGTSTEPISNHTSPRHLTSPPIQLLDDGGEVTMDLGTPLQPTMIVLPMVSHQQEREVSSSDLHMSAPSPLSERLGSPDSQDRPSAGDLINTGSENMSSQRSPAAIPPSSYSPLPLSPPDSGYPLFTAVFSSHELRSPTHDEQIRHSPDVQVTEVDVHRLETELDDAQRRLAESEDAISDIQALLSLQDTHEPP
ncbi:hypothetical protein K435DRAFT_38092 [Dendrothele bispora CBS 962.96]|uniref:Uncharacterized protein n=1 Tax=Dendrothele bispora (strain CBS 962.96) TaxID=1314807 RepID=A0A4S8M753_DENBC|nr:hypothetical protein K435DRAFT_38092 [Dendrothele bispora CBS 962.96]